MFEFHGWFVIWESPSEIDTGHLTSIAERLQTYITALDWGSSIFIETRWLNGNCILNLGGSPNRQGAYKNDIDKLFRWVAKEAPGSYGLLYWRDSGGNAPAGQNNFQVEVMTRGTVSTRFDPFLSPAIPVLEDPIG